MDQQQIVEILRKSGYKLTPQRRMTIDALLAKGNEHFSVDELYRQVKEESPEVGMSTIYRTVQILEEMGIITRRN